ncbi:MAG: quinone oxidoreductase [Candidatus Competibacterales bacterium]|nr:quinone oxidoreductase [Candidatus Competibacterales bacterium]
MTHAIRIHEYGGPEVLRWEQVDVGEPGPGEVRVRNVAVGLNYIEVYQRTGLYPLELPSGLGMEAAGTVEAVGPDVEEFAVGDRVASGTGPAGAYSEVRIVPVRHLVRVPEGIDLRQAGAMMLQGLTARYLIRETYRVQAGETVLFHAAAGGVGLIACQWLKHLGATVIGTVGTEEKAELARAHGCDHPIIYSREDFAARVRELTGGEGVPVVYDAVGRDTWEGSLNALRRRGMLVSFGNASGPVEPFSPLLLSQKGSLYLTRPTLMGYTATREELLTGARELFEVVQSGAVKIEVNQTYPLAEATQAHRDLEARRTTGSTILLP